MNDSCRYRVLVVDDMATNRVLVRAQLPSDEFEVVEAANGVCALERLGVDSFDTVLVDIMMPGIDGLELCRRIRANSELSLLPLIIVTTLGAPEDIARGIEAGADDYITKPFHAVELIARVRSAAEKKRLTDGFDEAESVLLSMARMVEAKDPTTAGHCDRLAHMSVVFGRKLGLPPDSLEALRRGGVLHDIGKLGVPDSVLLKPGKLSLEERMIMERHPVIGAELCRPLRTMRNTVEIIRSHHEQWHGGGYPDGLAGSEIPLLARVFQIVDVYDALVSKRVYKESFSVGRAVEILEEETREGKWDPELVEVFLGIVRDDPDRLAVPTAGLADLSVEIFKAVAGASAVLLEEGGPRRPCPQPLSQQCIFAPTEGKT